MPDPENKTGLGPGDPPISGRRVAIPINQSKPPIDVKAEVVEIPPPVAPDALPREVTDKILKAINNELVGILPRCNFVTLVVWPKPDGTTKLAMLSTYHAPQDVRQVLEEVVKKLEGMSLGGL